MKKALLFGLLTGILLLAVGMGLNYLLGALFPQLMAEYENVAIFRPWDDPKMSLFFIYPFLVALLLAFAWTKHKNAFQGSTLKKGLIFGLTYFAIATIPGMLVSYSSFQVSALMIGGWTLSGLLDGIIAGLIYAKWLK
ncbi:MAG: hypothetical protein WC604_02260 [Candidatus Gracilibacteria bacterium]